MHGNHHSGKKNGFSLLELMVVLVIIATLLALAIPNYKASFADADQTMAKVKLLEWVNDLENEFRAHQTYDVPAAHLWKQTNDSPAISYAISVEQHGYVVSARLVKSPTQLELIINHLGEQTHQLLGQTHSGWP